MARRRRKHHDEGGHGGDERWLVSYADMMTLLVALFLVLFSISSVNKSKLDSVQRSLESTFSAPVLTGGKSIKETGGSPDEVTPAAAQPTQSLRDYTPGAEGQAMEARDFDRVAAAVEARAREAGVADKVSVRETPRGLEISLLSDGLLFESGQARLQPKGVELLGTLAPTLEADPHRVVVEGHTDSVPSSGSAYPSNWELSTARSSAVVRALVALGVKPGRMEASGRAQLDPVASNATPEGRAKNRRVEVVLPRQGQGGQPS